jgi:IS30 family transposase
MGHLTEAQRYTIQQLKAKGFKQKAIAEIVGKDKSVISLELKRNSDKRNGEYRAELANRKYKERLKNKAKAIKLTSEVKEYIDKKLKDRWSPEQISKTPTKEVPHLVSHERIYQYIHKDQKQGGELYKNLRRKKKYRKRLASDNRGRITDQKNISQRPKIVDQRERIGDLEVDLVIGANHKGVLLTINDLKTGMAWIRKLENKDSYVVAQAITEELMPIKEYIHTITADNGKEFAQHKIVVGNLGIDFYFADPYSSWQRGANENLNGLIRDYFPKKTNFEQITQEDVDFVVERLNLRPRKRLGFVSPLEYYNSLLKKVAFKT